MENTNNINIRRELGIYKVEEIARDFDFHINTIRRYIREGKLKAKKIGRDYFITRDELLRFFSEPEALEEDTNDKI